MTELALVPEIVPSLAECEQVIEDGLHSFVEVGLALMTIREQGYYSRYGTFEDYCRERWGFERAHAYRQIEASEVVRALSPMGDIAPARERHARELVPLLKKAPDHLAEAWQKALDQSDGKPTAKLVKAVVAEYVPAKKKPQPKQPPKVDPASLDDQARLSRLYSSLEYLARMGTTPYDMSEAVPADQAYRIDEFLEEALAWVNAFGEWWEKKQHGVNQ